MVFINCSNHPKENWLKEQIDAALEYGDIIDISFPNVPVDANDEVLNRLVEDTFEKIVNYNPEAVMCMGEFVVCYRLVKKLKENGLKVLATSSERRSNTKVNENGEIIKESTFVFCGFREY